MRRASPLFIVPIRETLQASRQPRLHQLLIMKIKGFDLDEEGALLEEILFLLLRIWNNLPELHSNLCDSLLLDNLGH